MSETEVKGIKWMCLNAPERATAFGCQYVRSWFDYQYLCSGSRNEDWGDWLNENINENHLEAMRYALHNLILEEANALGNVGRVLLVGSSQGGSMALDAALTLPSKESVAGVIMLRSVPLSATATYLGQDKLKREKRLRSRAVPVLAVNGEQDAFYELPFVRQQISLIDGLARTTLRVVRNLDHDTYYDNEEIAMTVAFIAESLKLKRYAAVTLSSLVLRMPASPPWTRLWTQLSSNEITRAKQLGCQSAEDWDCKMASVWWREWKDLSFMEKEAAIALGYSEKWWP